MALLLLLLLVVVVVTCCCCCYLLLLLLLLVVVVVVVVTCCYLLLLVVAGNQRRRTYPPNDKSPNLRGPSAWNDPHHEGGYHCSMPQVEKPIHPWKVSWLVFSYRTYKSLIQK